jgi:hypothetical protein
LILLPILDFLKQIAKSDLLRLISTGVQPWLKVVAAVKVRVAAAIKAVELVQKVADKPRGAMDRQVAGRAPFRALNLVAIAATHHLRQVKAECVERKSHRVLDGFCHRSAPCCGSLRPFCLAVRFAPGFPIGLEGFNYLDCVQAGNT